MDTRYHIEELVSQDSKGVVFQGIDSVTGVVVAMRRFIATGGGDEKTGKNEREAYCDAITVLKKVSHPSLRRVLAGGCDSVDGMPYLVTRWVEGVPLGEMVAIKGPLDPELVRQMLGQFLNANVTLAKALGREGLWLEASLDSVIVKPPRDEGEPPVALFWLCPWSWLRSDASRSDAMPLADFAEAMLGGPRKIAASHADEELPQWIQRIRNKEISSLQEAQESLKVRGTPVSPFVLDGKSAQDVENGDPGGKSMLLKTGAGPASAKKGQGPRPLAVAGGIPVAGAPPIALEGGKGVRPATWVAAVVLLGLIIFVSWRIVERKQAETTSPQTAEELEAPHVAIPPSQRQSRIDEMITQIQRNEGTADEPSGNSAQGGIYSIEEAGLLLDREGHAVTLRGRLARVRFSNSGLTMYLEFSEEAPPEEPRAYAMTHDLVDGIRAEELQLLVGKRIEIRGAVDIESVSGTLRPRIKLRSRDQINVLEAEADYELR